MTWVLVAVAAVAAVPAGLRWLRVIQREHYLAPSATRFAVRWWRSGAVNSFLGSIAVAGFVGSVAHPWFGFLVCAAQVGPVGLSIRGRTSPLAWTARLKRVAYSAGLMTAVIFVTAGLTDTPVIAAGGLLLMPVILDGATIALGPLEKRLGDRWVKQAGTRLRASGADVVAITGSYGKTTTKGYVAHLLGGSMRVVASPASFNNRMGLARAINEHLAPGTSVFIAEMGTYGPGEISEICEWIRPRVAAIVAVGPVHLERFRTEERIVNAKAEILDRAEIGVVAIDNPMLATIASSRAQTMNIITAGTGSSEARVLVRDSDLIIDGHFVASVPEGVYGTNLAVATGISLALGLHPGEVAERIAGLPVAEHRGSITISGRGVTVIDDTYNSNPAGAAAALDSLARAGANGKRVVVTPGMVELGPRQKAENFAFAQRASEESDVLLIVGRTNRVSLTEGASNGSASVTVVSSREDAVAWVRDNLSEGDAVLYENDLPDHYP